jgi:hypothetical protein
LLLSPAAIAAAIATAAATAAAVAAWLPPLAPLRSPLLPAPLSLLHQVLRPLPLLPCPCCRRSHHWRCCRPDCYSRSPPLRWLLMLVLAGTMGSSTSTHPTQCYATWHCKGEPVRNPTESKSAQWGRGLACIEAGAEVVVAAGVAAEGGDLELAAAVLVQHAHGVAGKHLRPPEQPSHLRAAAQRGRGRLHTGVMEASTV